MQHCSIHERENWLTPNTAHKNRLLLLASPKIKDFVPLIFTFVVDFSSLNIFNSFRVVAAVVRSDTGKWPSFEKQAQQNSHKNGCLVDWRKCEREKKEIVLKITHFLLLPCVWWRNCVTTIEFMFYLFVLPTSARWNKSASRAQSTTAAQVHRDLRYRAKSHHATTTWTWRRTAGKKRRRRRWTPMICSGPSKKSCKSQPTMPLYD